MKLNMSKSNYLICKWNLIVIELLNELDASKEVSYVCGAYSKELAHTFNFLPLIDKKTGINFSDNVNYKFYLDFIYDALGLSYGDLMKIHKNTVEEFEKTNIGYKIVEE